jgi:hypothetical protein
MGEMSDRQAEASDLEAALEELESLLEEIEQALDRGETDLRRLGFWRALGPVKRDPALAGLVADRAGRIDRRAFEARVHPLAPVWVGNLVLVAGIVAGVGAVVVAVRADSPTIAGLALIAAAGIWSFAIHGLAHWVVGRIVGIRFLAYFIGGPPPPRPGLKSDYSTYLRASPWGRAWMHASGAIATKVAPFVALALYPLTEAPAWAAWSVLALGIVQIVTDVLFSTKSSDWKKFNRERRAARPASDARGG